MDINFIIANAADWRSAVKDIIQFKVSNNECFSSGEIAALLRNQRSDLAFSVTGLGNFVRDLYFAGSMPSYPSTGMRPIQVGRETTGKGRTPAYQTVFVYGPDSTTASAHDFEVDIPIPPVDGKAPKKAPKAASAAPKAPKAPNIPGALTANLWDDGRMAIPRVAIDAFLSANGQTTQPDTKVWVLVESDRVVVTLEGQAPAREIGLWAGQGRLAVKTKAVGCKGKIPLSVDREALVVELPAV